MLKLLRLLVIVALITYVTAQYQGYDSNLAREYWYMSSASYCRTQKIIDWSCGQPCTAPRPTDVLPFYNSTGDSSGFAAYSPTRNQIMVVFRGTVPWLIKNWLSDLDLNRMNYPLCDNGCQVHSGFLKAYLQIDQQVQSAVRTLRNKHGSASILVTGHSLGASMATHALLYLQNSGHRIDYFITYGSPRVGDRKFTDYVKRAYSGFKQRVTHSHDPVPHLALASLGFVHINTEIYYSTLTDYKICGDDQEEDNNCSNQNIVDLNIDDHIHHFDLDQILATPMCQ